MIQPWMIRAVAIGIVCVAIFSAGYQVKTWRVKSELADALQQQKAEFAELDKQRLESAEELERQLEQARKQKEVRYVEKQKIINRPVYRECKLDDDGLQLIRRQIREANTARKHAYPMR